MADLASRYSTDELRHYVAENGSPLLLVDHGRIREDYRNLCSALPRVRHHYAIKSFPTVDVVQTLESEGASFDIASKGEIALVESLGIAPQRCLYTHPILRPQDVAEAVRFGITRFVIDSEFQLDAFSEFTDVVEVLLRIAIPNEEAQINLSSKFGIAPIWAKEFIKEASDRGVSVCGVSFHAGSQMYDASKMVDGIRVARKIFDDAAETGASFGVLDIGGGFPAGYNRPIPDIDEFCTPVRDVLDDLFPDTEIVAEPGRGVVARSVVSVASVMGKSVRNGVMWYYLDDGVYGTYSGVLFEHGDYPIFTLKELDDPDIVVHSSVLAGPTCDSVDVIAQDFDLPELDAGDVVVSPNMGAYSYATTTDFNLFPRAKIVVTNP